MQDFNVSVAQIIGRPGEYRDITVVKPLEAVATALARLDERPVAASLRLESVVEGVLVSGRVQATAGEECARCLMPFGGPLTVEICELFAAPGHEPTEPDGYRVTGLEIHLEPLLRDALTLALPLNPLCREDCAGLCPSCGKDLNQGACGCADEETDPRWAPLADLRDKLANKS